MPMLTFFLLYFQYHFHQYNNMADFISCRRILSIMVIIGFMIHHMIRINISIAMVDMIIIQNGSNNTSEDELIRFHWNEEQKNDILGCFFWGYLLTQVPGGRFSEIFGTRIVLGSSMLLSSILTLLVPTASFLGFYSVIAARVCLGFAMGVQWPSIPPIASRWIAPTNTSQFMSHMIASSLGAAITLPVCGFLIAYFGWPSVFYVTGSVALIWTLGWFYLIYDTPRQHPRISKEEKEKVEREIGSHDVRVYMKIPIPWTKMLLSGPVWAIILTNTFSSLTFFIVLTQLPSYMHQILHFNIKENGLFSSMPYILRYFTAATSSYLADKIRKTNKFSTVSIRIFFTSLCCLGPSLLFTLQIFAGSNRLISVMVFTLSLGFYGFGTAGFFTNCLDIAPTYSGTVYGLSNAVAAVVGYGSTKMVALITKEKQDFEQWIYIFWVLVGANFFGFLVYIIFASGEIQSWDPKFKAVTKNEKLLADEAPKTSDLH